MFAVIDKHTRVALYLTQHAPNLTVSGLDAESFSALDVNSETHEVIAVESPVRWVGAGALRYTTQWEIANADVYDASAPTPEQLREVAKAARAAAVESITVTTTAGNTFDGNEEAQRRMTSAITAMTDTDLLPWILYNNTVIMASKAELTEALRLAGMQMASIWITPYTGQ